MSTTAPHAASHGAVLANADGELHLISVEVLGQSWGIPISAVREVLGPQSITPVPLAPPAVVGSLNLRGRIVTLLDLRIPLGFPRTTRPEEAMQVVIDHQGELYSLMIDEVGDSLTLPAAALEPPPKTLDQQWRGLTDGIVRMDKRLLLILSLDRVVETVSAPA